MVGPVCVLYATFLAKKWITASADSKRSSALLPSTPQYLLSVGNLGTPTISALGASAMYIFRRRTILSPIFTRSTICLASLILAATMIAVGDVWLHFSSTAVADPGVPLAGQHNFSRAFAPTATPEQSPWRLQQGLKTFLDANSVSAIQQIDNTTLILPQTIPGNTNFVASTIGMNMDCQLISSQCTFDNESSSSPTFDCSDVEPGASGPIGSVNATLFPSQNSTDFTLIASMALSSLFNQSATVLTFQVFQCIGSLRNIQYSFTNGQYDITQSTSSDTTPLADFLDLDSFQGKRDLVESAMNTVGISTIYVTGTDVTTMPTSFSDGLARLVISFLAGETIPTPSIKVLLLIPLTQETTSSNKILSRIPLAPVIFLAVVVVSVIIATFVVGLLAILAISNPPRLDGHPISIVNLINQLTSPMSVLSKTLGDGPLAMKIQLDTSEKGVRFDITRPTPDNTRNRDTRDDDVGSMESEPQGFAPREFEPGEFESRFQEIQIDANELVQPRGFEFEAPARREIPRSPAGFQPVRRDSELSSESVDDEGEDSRTVFERGVDGRGSNQSDPGSFEGEVGKRRDEMSEEEGRVFIGYQQRQLARENQANRPPYSWDSEGFS
jgi:hypothetical protein